MPPEIVVDPLATSSFLGILRGIREQAIEPLVEAVFPTGLRALEITMNTKGAPGLIRRLTQASGGRLTVGAGTVLSMADPGTALDAGAEFIVSPTLIPEVVKYCVANAIPVFPGALTPQEIFAAHRAGATMVKLFPASAFGSVYLREIKGPFRDIRLLACAGARSEPGGPEAPLRAHWQTGSGCLTFKNHSFG